MKHELVQTDTQTRVTERIEVDINAVVPNSRGEDYEGKVVVLKREVLSEPYASADRRFIAEGGYGAKPYKYGARYAIIGRYTQDGARDSVKRHQVEGLAVNQKYGPFPPELEY